jgi:transcription elongation factor Elf1
MPNDPVPVTKSVSAQKSAFVTPPDAPTKRKFPSEVIDLPSEGYFYPEGSPLSTGRIELKLMTAKEEDILTSQNLIKKGVVLDELLKALIVTEGVKLDDLLIGDKNAIFIAARRLAYGDDYPVKITCPKCDQENEIIINLGMLKSKPFDFSQHTRGENSFTFTLPYLKKTIVYKLMTHKDEQDVDAELKNINKKIGTTASPEMTTRLKYMIMSVDGNEDRKTIREFVDDIPARDSVVFRKFMREHTPDIDMTFNFKCAHCGHEERMALPLGVDFFWPTT